MDTNQANPLQIFARLLDGKTATLRFGAPHASCDVIKERIFQITGIPVHSQRLVYGRSQLSDGDVVSATDTTVHLLLRLHGGKGGFGSLLRGAATKAGQKKTNNFDACRDMSGRRLRHVNAEKRLEEWKAEEEERKMEKIAEEFIKKQAKESGKKSHGNGEVEKYVEKYREISGICVAEVEEAVREACQSSNLNGKRKKKGLVELEGAEAAKKLKTWMGKRKMDESDSEGMDNDSSDDDDSEDENQKSIILNDRNHSDLNKEADESSDSVTGAKRDGQCSTGSSSESGTEEEKEVAGGLSLRSSPSGGGGPNGEENVVEPKIHVENTTGGGSDYQSLHVTTGENEVETGQTIPEAIGGGSDEGRPVENVSSADVDPPLNFDDFNSAAELEVLGMERLKSELQAHGLKCGGTLQERAARLFLLKSIPLEKIPKKLLAKK